jgi:hypothetical protein
MKFCGPGLYFLKENAYSANLSFIEVFFGFFISLKLGILYFLEHYIYTIVP